MEQMEFNLEAEKTPEELIAEYKELVGVSPRTTDVEYIKEALKDPMAERERIAQLDAAEDKEDIKSTYRR